MGAYRAVSSTLASHTADRTLPLPSNSYTGEEKEISEESVCAMKSSNVSAPAENSVPSASSQPENFMPLGGLSAGSSTVSPLLSFCVIKEPYSLESSRWMV